MIGPWTLSGATPTEAVILAGGMGTRLRSIVSDVPKPMAEVAGRPFLEYLIFQLRAAGIPRAVLCTGYRSDVIRDHFGDGERWGIELSYSVELEPLGTGGALKLAEPLLATDVFLLMNGDSLFDIPLADLAAAHGREPAPATIALARVAPAGRYGGVTLAPDGQVSAFVEKPDVSAPEYINGGLYMIERTTLGLIPADGPVSFEREVLPALVGNGLRGVPFDGYFVDIGVPDDYLAAQRATDVLARLAAVDSSDSS